ncbi:P-loop containing nucleoside triphosphate hydrolase protein [Mycena belliarum]|uniref:RNA helicase n=1 Tax=Mycena belliarum TaxID=1033014 RepID=A0AAD6XUJ8_9AGAR|nr:P-loop containing nucleoside triphosphate hydrolase protein [Mycena belliae]
MVLVHTFFWRCCGLYARRFIHKILEISMCQRKAEETFFSEQNSRLSKAHLASFDGPHIPSATAKPKSFGALGLHPPIVSALRTAFPTIRNPTKNQAILIPALLEGRDIFLQDRTGSGKSFGVVLGLLNKPRAKGKPRITSIFIVPHRELAHQLYGWVERMFAPAASIPSSSISLIAQVLVRDSQGSGLNLLRESPPHILFSTPQALMDAWREQPDALQLKSIQTIVADEADYLIPTIDYGTSRKRKLMKQRQHAGETQQFLDLVYGNNTRLIADEDRPPERDSPQLIISSATLPTHLVDYVSEESGWIDRDNWVSISGASSESRARQPKSEVMHSVLVASDDHVRNIAGALPSRPSFGADTAASTEKDYEEPIPEMDPALVESEPPQSKRPDMSLIHCPGYMQTASPFNPLALETIAMIFAADVPSTALLVIPSTAPVRRAIFELRRVGVDAHGLDLLKKRSSDHGAVRANPTLLVSTWANTRGLDVRDLSHVFVLGVPSGGTTTYVHIAGRVGRLESTGTRRAGRIVMVVGPEEEDAARELLQSIKCDATELHVEMQL